MNEKSIDATPVPDEPVAPPPSGFAEQAKSAYASAKDSAGRAAHAAGVMGKSAGNMMANAAKATGRKIGEAGVLVGDLNNDGKVDHEDAKIAMAKAKDIGSKVAVEAGNLAKEVSKHDMVKDAAAGAAIGAVVAIPLPIIGPFAGAALGAIAGVFKNLKSDTNIFVNSASEKRGRKK